MCYKGYKMKNESIEKMSKFQKGKTVSNSTRKKLSEKAFDKKHTEETKEKISKFHLGKSIKTEIKDKISKTLQGTNMGKKNPNWQGGVSKISAKIRSCNLYFKLEKFYF
jgi:uncharacterized protein YlbG (UPF0298 family)